MRPGLKLIQTKRKQPLLERRRTSGCRQRLLHPLRKESERKVQRAPKPKEQAERTLVQQTKSGSADAFADLVRMYSQQIYQISMKMLQNHADAEDNVQNALWKAFGSIDRFEGRSRFSTWLIQIAINEALMRIRGRGPVSLTLDLAKPVSGKHAVLDISDGRADPERRYIAKELMAKAFLGLPASLVDAFIRNKAEGWTQRELAAEIGITLSALKSRMFQARGRMQEQLKAIC